MSQLQWDQTGDRRYQSGVDRGVLYTVDGVATPWNGLTSVQENAGGSVKPYHMDGVKYLDHFVPGSYSAKLEAFTYPDILDDLTGVGRYAPGVFLHDQPARVFHLSYRTGEGNDVDANLGYRIHVIYNVMAVPSGAAMATMGANVDPAKLSWDLTATPPPMIGARPTAHISLHSLSIDQGLLDTIEGLLYGTAEEDALLPSMVDLLTMVEGS